jgi:hypothetical protein
VAPACRWIVDRSSAAAEKGKRDLRFSFPTCFSLLRQVGADVPDERQEEGLEQLLAASASNNISPAADLLA